MLPVGSLTKQMLPVVRQHARRWADEEEDDEPLFCVPGTTPPTDPFDVLMPPPPLWITPKRVAKRPPPVLGAEQAVTTNRFAALAHKPPSSCPSSAVDTPSFAPEVQ